MKENSKHPLLIVEDSNEDFEALSRTITKIEISTTIYRCEDGEDALDFLYHEGKYQNSELYPNPALIILDLNLPGTDGREVLSVVKQDNDLKSIPVVILTTSSNPKDVKACYHHGVSGYIVKPMNTGKLQESVETFINYWFKAVELPP